MSSADDTPTDDTTAEDAPVGEPAPCLACRGTGTLISGKGGEPHDVSCPWCEGTGTRVPGIDAQDHPAEGEIGAGADAGGTADGDSVAATPDAAANPDAAAETSVKSPAQA